MLPALAKAILAGRFLRVVFFLGLVCGLALFAVRFVGKLWKLTTELWEKTESDLLIDVLHLLDSALVASLVLIIKIKVATAMVAISSFHLLQVFLQTEVQNETAIFWRVVIHIVFLIGAVLLGVLDRLGAHHGDAGKNEKV